MFEKKNLNFKIEMMTLQDESQIETLIFDGIAVKGDGKECCLCGLKIRNGGKHSWVVHKYNGTHTLLPVEPEKLWDNPEISQGGTAIGSECRKQLPQQFVKKWSI